MDVVEQLALNPGGIRRIFSTDGPSARATHRKSLESKAGMSGFVG
jgi:hypothetical protein